MISCLYALGGINYKNGVITCCPRQANQLVFTHETILPSKIYNHENFKNLRKSLYENKWPSGCDTCEDMEKDNLKSMRQDFILRNNKFYKSNGNSLANSFELMKCYDINSHSMDFKGFTF